MSNAKCFHVSNAVCFPELSAKMDRFSRLNFHESADRMFNDNSLPYPSTVINIFDRRFMMGNPERFSLLSYISVAFSWRGINLKEREVISSLCHEVFGEMNIKSIDEDESSSNLGSTFNMKLSSHETGISYTDRPSTRGTVIDGRRFSSLGFSYDRNDISFDFKNRNIWAYLLIPESINEKKLKSLCEEWYMHENVEYIPLGVDSDDEDSYLGGDWMFNNMPDVDMFLTWLIRDYDCIEINPKEYK